MADSVVNKTKHPEHSTVGQLPPEVFLFAVVHNRDRGDRQFHRQQRREEGYPALRQIYRRCGHRQMISIQIIDAMVKPYPIFNN